MVAPGFKPKKGEKLRALWDFIFGFENKKGEVLDYWIDLYDGLTFSPQEFYDIVSKGLEQRKVPGMEISKEEFAEGGLLSDKRIYLKLFRERLAIYACAGSFGTSFIFSCRTVYVPALVRLWHIIATFAFFAVIGWLLILPLGMSFTIIALIALVCALVAVFRNASRDGDLDALLLKIPAVSTIYEDWFRADSYWRDDTRTAYLQRIPQVIKARAEEITAKEGVKLVQKYHYSPILGELHKPIYPKSELPLPED